MDLNGTATVQGTIHGNTIELDHDLGLPDGESVTVVVKAKPKLPADYEAIVRRLAGAWADEGPELDDYLRNCRKEDPNERPELEP
jgi:hypothetical protein